MGDSNGQRPSRRNPAGRSCSAVVAAFVLAVATLAAIPAVAGTTHRADTFPCGTFDSHYDVNASPPYAEGDIESNPCNLQLRVHLRDTLHGLAFDHYSGWVEALELNTKAAGDTNSVVQLIEYQQENDGGGSRMCQEFYPVKGAWHAC